MYGDKQIRLRQIRNSGAVIERNVTVIPTRVNYFRTKTALEQFAQALRNLEDQIFFEQSSTPDSPEIPSTMAGIHDNAHLRHASTQLQVFLGWRRNHNCQ